MRAIRLVLTVLAFAPITTLAQPEKANQPQTWPEGSAMRTGELLVEKQKQTEKVLAAKHQELVKLVSAASSADGSIKADARLVAAIKAQQAAWLKYRVDECELVGTLSGAGGTWPSTYANQCEANLTDLRLRRVRSALRCITKIPVGDRLSDQNACLYQLAPLAAK
jgi:uncharacterized protein YecT (DUF1311 family)